MPTDPTRTADESTPLTPGTGEFAPTEGTGEFSVSDPTSPPPSLPSHGATAASVSNPAPAGPAIEGTMDLTAPAPPARPSRVIGMGTGGLATARSVSSPAPRPPIEGTIDLPTSQAGNAPAGGGTFAYAPNAHTDGNFVLDQSASSGGGTEVHEASQAGTPYDPTAAPAGVPAPAPALAQANFDGPRYDLKKVFARGGMGEVWLTEDTAIGRIVALKKMRKQMRGKEDQFFWEGQITGQLEHPGIVPVHELGVDERGEPFYVMKFVHGKTLLQEIEAFHEAPAERPSREVERIKLVQVFLAMCQTLAYAHSRGVVHRDIKPENVMIGKYGETLVLDWGLAKMVGKDEQAETAGALRRQSFSGETFETLAGSVKGTPWYMAPEVAAGDVHIVDHVSDVYLLGATLYHLLTGKLPREGKTLPELISAAHKPPVPPRSIDPSISKPLAGICLKAMAVERADRYQSAESLAEDLQHYLAGEPVTAYRETFTERAWRWARRHRRAIGRVAAVLAVLAVAGVGYSKYRDIERQRAEERAENDRKLKDAEAKRVAEAEAARLEQERLQTERDEEARKAKELARQKQATADLKRFRQLAEEMRFLAASTHPAAAKAPFSNPKAGLAKGEEALALAAHWGPRLDAFPLAAERPALAGDTYDLLLLMAQVRSQAGGPKVGEEVLALLDRAAGLRATTRSYHRLRSQALASLGQAAPAAAEAKQAADPATPLTAADHFLLGEVARIPLTRPENLQDRTGAFRPNRAALEAAIAEYRLALRAEPNHYWANFQLGQCLVSLDKVEEGIQALGACVALQPESPWGYSTRGVHLTYLKRFDDAAADLERAIALDPTSRLHRMRLGVLVWTRGEPEAALKIFDVVLAPPAEKQFPEAAFYKAQIYNQLGRLDDALVAADRALAGKPPVRLAYLFRAQIHLVQGHTPEAIDDLNGFLAGADPSFDPKSPAAAGQRGRRLRLIAQDLSAGQDKHRAQVMRLARSELQSAVDRGGGTAEVLEDLGRVQQLLGQTANAIRSYSQALEKVPEGAEHKADRVRLLVMRGWALQELPEADLENGRADFEAAVRLAPDDAEAHAGLGYVEACRKSGLAARREAQLAVLYRARDYLILHNVACVFAKLSEVEPERAREFEDLALDYLARAVELWRRDRTGPNELVQIRRESAFGKKLRARPEFQRLLEE